jgi:hypothetical protein
MKGFLFLATKIYNRPTPWRCRQRSAAEQEWTEQGPRMGRADGGQHQEAAFSLEMLKC